MSDIFLSYAREDAARVEALADELTQLGWSLWWDDRIRAAAEFDDAIERALDSAACVVVVWSRSSVGSGWVRAEASSGNDQGKLVPIRFESDVIPPLRFRQLNVATLGTGALATPSGDALRMLAEITRLTGKTPANIDPDLLRRRTDGSSSGARSVTAGKWKITARMLGVRGRFSFDLHPNGTVSGTGSMLIFRSKLAGRWIYDAAQDVLQLELSGGAYEGTEVIRIPITKWLDDHTAACRYLERKARLERVGG